MAAGTYQKASLVIIIHLGYWKKWFIEPVKNNTRSCYVTRLQGTQHRTYLSGMYQICWIRRVATVYIGVVSMGIFQMSIAVSVLLFINGEVSLRILPDFLQITTNKRQSTRITLAIFNQHLTMPLVKEHTTVYANIIGNSTVVYNHMA